MQHGQNRWSDPHTDMGASYLRLAQRLFTSPRLHAKRASHLNTIAVPPRLGSAAFARSTNNRKPLLACDRF